MHARLDDLSPHFAVRALPRDAVFETPIAPADAILVLGNRSLRELGLMAAHAASLYRQKFAPVIIVSGGVPDYKGMLEADRLHRMLRRAGVPDSAIHRERRATNTLENIVYARELARRIRGMPPRPRIIAIGQRYASRRYMMTLAAQWPECLPMSSPVCGIGTPAHKWEICANAMSRVASEAAKIPVYQSRGHIAPIDEQKLLARIRAAVHRGFKPRRA